VGNDETEQIKTTEYFGNGAVTEFKFGKELSRVFKDGKLSWLASFGEAWGMMPSETGVVFVDNHDTERGASVLNYKDGRATCSRMFHAGLALRLSAGVFQLLFRR